MPRFALPTRSAKRLLAAPIVAALLFTATACGAPGWAPAQTVVPESAVAPMSPEATAAARQQLAGLAIKGRAPKTGYSREEFGPAWTDVDHNGCDTRNDILARDLATPTFKEGRKQCVVLTGRLSDPYTATTIDFTRGQGTSTAVQIDHVVALSDAWQKGAQQLSVEQRTALANDPANLLAVDGPTNSSKSDGDAATWLPPNKAYRCQYVSRQITVKSTYGLWVTQAEHDAMDTVLATC
ncbi:HNH endonuclease family protein [Arthrobacter sp. 35W]|uniref:HNH endonuclease family protein n=1 Tax=Arthrobacter sp. 35W TaxID=1132441 RepID=UPI0004127897|nr:HNH endonuclease family protein [Arthrobacter sp. 35W]